MHYADFQLRELNQYVSVMGILLLSCFDHFVHTHSKARYYYHLGLFQFTIYSNKVVYK